MGAKLFLVASHTRRKRSKRVQPRIGAWPEFPRPGRPRGKRGRGGNAMVKPKTRVAMLECDWYSGNARLTGTVRPSVGSEALIQVNRRCSTAA